jgi:hypothetical protein
MAEITFKRGRMLEFAVWCNYHGMEHDALNDFYHSKMTNVMFEPVKQRKKQSVKVRSPKRLKQALEASLEDKNLRKYPNNVAYDAVKQLDEQLSG